MQYNRYGRSEFKQRPLGTSNRISFSTMRQLEPQAQQYGSLADLIRNRMAQRYYSDPNY